MGIYTTRQIRELTVAEFKAVMAAKEPVVSLHATDHLDAQQRKVFKEKELTVMVERENPRKAYLQQNGRYAAYYRRADGYRKLIIEIENTKAVIVSFMDPQEIPKINVQP